MRIGFGDLVECIDPIDDGGIACSVKSRFSAVKCSTDPTVTPMMSGMTLETIQRLLPCVQNNDPAFTPCNELRRILAEQVDLISERIETLSQSRTILVG